MATPGSNYSVATECCSVRLVGDGSGQVPVSMRMGNQWEISIRVRSDNAACGSLAVAVPQDKALPL